MAVARETLRLAGREVAAGLERQQRNLAGQQRGIDPLAFAALLTGVERADDGVGGEHAGPDVGDRDAELGRRATGVAGQAHPAAHALKHLVEGRLLGARPSLPESRDRTVNQTLVQRLGLLVAEPESVHRPWPKVLDQYVRPLDQSLENPASGRSF